MESNPTNGHQQTGHGANVFPPDLRPVDELLRDLSASWQRQLPSADAFNARLPRLLEAASDDVSADVSHEHPAAWRSQAERAMPSVSGTGRPVTGRRAERQRGSAGGSLRRLFPAVAALLLVALGASIFGVVATHRATPGTTSSRVSSPTATPSPTTPPIMRVTAAQPQNTHLPLAANAYLQSISFSSAGDGWVTGGISVPDYAGADFSVERSQLVHYHDGQWTAAQETFRYGGVDLVAMVSADEGWAIGNLTADVTFKTATPPTLLHYTGGHWQRVGPFTTGPVYFASLRMLSADFGYASGANLDNQTQQANPSIIMVYSRGTWTPIMSPIAAYSPLLMVSPDEGWAAGVNAQQGGAPGFYHYHNGSWSEVLPISGGSDTPNVVMSSLSMASPRDIWAAGTACAPPGQGQPTACRLVVYHFDGATWTPISPPDTSSVNWNQGTSGAEIFGDETGTALVTISTEDLTLPSAKRQYETVVYRYAHSQWLPDALPVPHIVLVGFASDHNGGTWVVGWTENPFASYVLYTQGDGTWRIYGHS